MRFAGSVLLAVMVAVLGSAAAVAQETPPSVLDEAEALCAGAPDGVPCTLARARVVAALAELVADAGNTRDRGLFIAPVRALLTNPAPEVRTSAFFALAKLAPDATDTPAIRQALFDPVSNVRGAAWAAAQASSDPVAREVIDRVPLRPQGRGYGPDPAPFDPVALGVSIPDRADYLWLTARLQEEGQLQFLTDATPAEVLAHFQPVASGSPLPPDAASRAHPQAGFLFGDFVLPQLYADPQVLVLPSGDDPFAHMVVVYHDIVFGRTGFTLVQQFRRPIVGLPRVDTPDLEPPPGDLPIGPATLAWAEAGLGLVPGAPAEETELYLAVRDAGGFGAEDYLELYPDGAYAAAMRALIAGPRLVLDDVSYPETGRIAVSLSNLPPGSTATVYLLDTARDYAIVDTLFLPDASAPAGFDLLAKHAPGIYVVRAEISIDGADALLELTRDLSIVASRIDLQLDKTAFAPGEPMQVRFTGLSGDPKDYLATAAAGSPASAYVTYVYTGGQRAGTATLAAPATPGAYEVRAYFRDDDSVIRASLPFTVTGDAAPPAAQPDPGVTAPPVVAPEPDSPSSAVVTPPTASGAALTLETALMPPGGTLRFAYSGMSGDGQDFIATAPAGSPPEAYLKYTYTNGARDGSATLVAPTKEGDYELRAIFGGDARTVQAMLPFTVKADVRLSLDKTVFAPGEAITVRFAGLAGATQDYIATARAGSEASAYVNYVYANGAREGSLSLKAPTEPGRYELRAYLQDDPNVVKASLPFTVE